MIRPVMPELADFLRWVPVPASCDWFGLEAVNRRVSSSNPARGAKTFQINHLDLGRASA